MIDGLPSHQAHGLLMIEPIAHEEEGLGDALHRRPMFAEQGFRLPLEPVQGLVYFVFHSRLR
jgi:hypothetical protein